MKHVIHISLLDDATQGERSDDGTRSVQLNNMHSTPIRDGENFQDVLKQIGWFDIAVEIEVDALNNAAITKMLIHPDSDLKDTANNRKFFGEQILKTWAMGERKPRAAAPEPSRNQVVIDFFMTLPESVEMAQTLLNQGLNVVAVLGAKGAMVKAYQKTNDTKGLIMTIQEEMVKQGDPLEVGPDGKRRFAFLIWKSTDPIDAPSESGVVIVGDPTDLKMINLIKSHGLGTTHNKFNLDEV